MNIDNIKLSKLQSFSDKGGIMTVVQSYSEIPYLITRVFSISATNCIRGNHAHKNCNQFIVCISGSIIITVDDGTSSKQFTLNSSSQGLHIPPGYWSFQEYRNSITTINVYCDLEYDESDYIRDYDSYLSYINEINRI